MLAQVKSVLSMIAKKYGTFSHKTRMTVMAKWLFSQLNLLADWEFRNHLNSSNWKPDLHSASEFNSDSVSPLIWPICVATQSPNPMETRSNVFESWCFWAVTLRKILIFHLISSFGNFVERHSFCIVLSEEPKTMRKLCLFHKISTPGN